MICLVSIFAAEEPGRPDETSSRKPKEGTAVSNKNLARFWMKVRSLVGKERGW
jgi:hypothetical protein